VAETRRRILSLGRQISRTDAKARVVVPQRMREALGPSVTMTTGPRDEIQCFADEDFENYVAAVAKVCHDWDRYELLDHLMLTPAEGGLEFDPSGRLTIREPFREESGVDKYTEVILLWRSGGWLDIWNYREYKAFRTDTAGYKKEQREALAGLPNPLAIWLGEGQTGEAG
jgi:DNA-binding transcriptional regulator/RsmH inhibitor MraZ